jgi:hypothetical protein
VSKRERRRLGVGGSLEAEGGIGADRASVEDARNLFFHAVREEAPQVLEGLRETALAAYRVLRGREEAKQKPIRDDGKGIAEILDEKEVRETLSEEEIRAIRDERNPCPDVLRRWEAVELRASSTQDELSADYVKLRDSLIGWTQEWKLEASQNVKYAWTLDRALKILCHWFENESAAKALAIDLDVTADVTVPDLKIRIPGWDVMFGKESWKDFKTRARRHIDEVLPRVLGEYRERLESRLVKPMGVLFDSCASGEMDSNIPHGMRRMVRYQILGESLRAIARRDLGGSFFNPKTHAVRQQVRRIADRIGLDLRPPSRPGRPRGRSTPAPEKGQL